MATHFILFVSDQQSSMEFYKAVLSQEPRLHVPGMTEFSLGAEVVLGLMPEEGIKRILGPGLPDPELARGIPRAEIYLLRSDAKELHARALDAGAKEISPFSLRNWGDEVAYVSDPDGHLLALAK